MKSRFLLLSLIPKLALAGTCCLGSGPKSFVQLRPLQTYELGLLSSFQDVYGRYNSFGDVLSSDKQQTLSLQLGATMRLAVDTDLFAVVPWVYRTKNSLNQARNSQTVGDVLAGFRYHLLDNLFDDEWYPKVLLTVALKAPTGTVEKLSANGALVPGTGNGLWEPSIGISAMKDYGFVILGFSPSYIWRLKKYVRDVNQREVKVNEGDRIELTESLIFPLTRSWSVSVGSTQAWEFSKQLNDVPVSDSNGRVWSGFLGTSYFLTRFWSVGLGFEASLPFAKFGVNQQASRSVSLNTNYSIF